MSATDVNGIVIGVLLYVFIVFEADDDCFVEKRSKIPVSIKIFVSLLYLLFSRE